MEFAVHVAEGGVGIGLAGLTYRSTGKIDSPEERHLAGAQGGEGAVEEGLGQVIQNELEHLLGQGIAGGQEATNAAGIGEAIQTPGSGHGLVLA